MADIKIHDIVITGAELFLDSESFMNDLGDDEMNIRGGDWSTLSKACATVGKDEWSTFSGGCRNDDVPEFLQ
ncbi:hypothetical protein NIES37_29300 [Tolypothrix tenuis PCC 7101]|uniref:Uncharacterized protein n=1 Tax=Tolypothrix tenuis PCC 7101 TaxID=231146 RepID=A0A1Z4MZQ5_9CYAN|nr:hypothetical protein [Aulosira sp. FACHB-113]BAY98952.1 hypothetical protein NIES37_29300 [Tolypothrix tenuis PCC 7101]BAZ77129.1 hypothetical protein NIES50_57320 [Aulosira laxa NIES-50]